MRSKGSKWEKFDNCRREAQAAPARFEVEFPERGTADIERIGRLEWDQLGDGLARPCDDHLRPSGHFLKKPGKVGFRLVGVDLLHVN